MILELIFVITCVIIGLTFLTATICAGDGHNGYKAHI
jgi:hypothetical protein